MDTFISDSTDPRAQLKRAYACFRTIAEQHYGDHRKDYVTKVKEYIVILACEEGFPYEVEKGIAIPKSLGKATFEEFKILNLMINKVADKYYEKLGRPMYLWQKDKFGLYKSISGRSRDEMFMEYPEV